MKPSIYHRLFGYNLGLLPNPQLALLEHGVTSIEQARQKSGATIGFLFAEEGEDQRVNGFLRDMQGLYGGNLIGMEFVSRSTPRPAIWQKEGGR